MAFGDNMMDLAMQITANPEQAQKAIQSVSEEVKSLGAMTQEQVDQQAAFMDRWRERLAGARQAVASVGNEEVAAAERAAPARQAELESMGLVKDAWMQNAAAAREYGASLQAATAGAATATEEQAAAASALEQHFTSFGSTVDAEIAGVLADADNVGVRMGRMGEEANAGIYKSLTGLREFRMVFAATIGLASFGFWINEWGRLGGYLADALDKMEGIHTVQNDIAMGAAFKALKQITAEEQKQLMQPHDASMARLYEQSIEARVKLLETLRAEAEGLKEGTLSGQQYAKALQDIAANSRQFGLKGPYGSVVDTLDKQIQAYRALETVEVEYEQKQQKSAKATREAANTQQKWDEAIATARVHLPPYIAEIDRLHAAIAQQESGVAGTVQILKQYQELQRSGFPSPARLGFEVPNAQAAGVLGGQAQQVRQLTEAQRLALPTARELARANAELAREYPNLTAAERQEWAQIMLTSDAYRAHIDSATRVRSSNAQLAGSFNALAIQVRTAFSEMAGQLTGWGGVATRVFDQVFNAVSRQIEIEKRQAAEHQITQFSMIKATIDGFKQLAPVRAAIDLAKGFEALGDLNFGRATQYFAGAALWGTVAAFQIASMAGAFQPGTSGSKAVATAGAAAASGSTTAPALASGSASAQKAQQSQQQPVILQVHFHGPVYGGPSGVRELAQKFNEAVNQDRMKLVASHTLYGRSLA